MKGSSYGRQLVMNEKGINNYNVVYGEQRASIDRNYSRTRGTKM